MDAIFINTVLAFIEGLALIISPCILPVLPIILAGSLTGSKARPLGIIIGFIITFTLFTLFARTIVVYAHIDSDILRDISYLILLLLGVVMYSTRLTDLFSALTSRLTGIGQSLTTVNSTESGMWGGMIFGGLIGIIWTPCAGPILAAVIVQSIVQHTTIGSGMVVFAFAVGAAVPMFLIACLGRRILSYFGFIRERTLFFRKLLGVIIIVAVMFLFYSTNVIPSAPVTGNHNLTASSLINGLEQPYQAPEIAGISAWINSNPVTIQQLKGKVILIDFWTYSCINCLRTLPYIKSWYDQYHQNGLEIIGIHSPEFDFEHDLANVKNAVQKLGIHYPVALDNAFATWQNFHNEYWPAHYLIDKNGAVVYEHFGEGEYDVTENNIRYLLGLNGAVKTKAPDQNEVMVNTTPETYLGYARMENFTNQQPVVRDKIALYQYPASLAIDNWSLQGIWLIEQDKVVSEVAGASVKLHFTAGEVYAVMGSAKLNKVQIKLNKKLIEEIPVSNKQLYTVIKLKSVNEGELEMIATQPGLEIYTFTFGG